MTDKELDDLFQKTLTGHQMPVPPGMWERVNPQNDKRRRGAFLWWSVLGVAALLVLTGTATWLHHSASEKATVAVTATGTENKRMPAAKETTPPEQPVQPAQNAGQPGSAAAATVSSDRDEEANNKAHNNATREDANQISSGNLSVASPGTRSLPTTNHTINGGGIIDRPGTPSVESNGTVTPGAGSKPEVPETSTNRDGSTPASFLANAPMQKQESTANAGNELIKQEIKKADSASGKQEAKAPMVTIKRIHGEKALGVELMIAGYGNDLNVYAAKAGNTITPFAEVNRKDKVLMHSAGISLRIDKPLTPHFSFKTGLQYLRTRQRVSYGYEDVNRTPSISSFNNDTIVSARLQTKQTTLTGFYNSFSVPVLINYHTNGSAMSFGATAGLMINVLSWYRGDVPEGSSYQAVAAKDVFRTRTGASLYAGVTASRQFGSFRLFAEPHIQYTLSSVTKSSATFRQKMTSYGIGIGIRKTIGK